MAGTGKELLTAEEVATYLGVRPISVYRWCREGRLPCLKVGQRWRIRRAALDDFLQRGEQTRTLVGQLRRFFEVPDQVIAVAETKELLHRLDAAFFQVGEARGGVLVKFYAGEPDSSDELRVALTHEGLAVAQLEGVGRFRFAAERDPLGGRAAALRAVLDEWAGDGRTIWAAFDWVYDIDLPEAHRQQEALKAIVDAGQLVLKTSVLQTAVDEWPAADLLRAQQLHRGMIWLSATAVSLSRRTPLPPA